MVVVAVIVAAVAAAAGYYYGRSSAGTSTMTVPPSYYPVTVKDASNRSVTVSAFPTRIVSLAPSDTQDLIALGLGKYIVGVDYYSYQLLVLLNATSDLPRNVTVFAPSLSLNVSGIVSLNPSIVVDEIGLISTQDAAKLAQAGLLTFYTNADFAPNYSVIAQWIVALGQVFNRNVEAQLVVGWMNQKIAQYEAAGVNRVAYMLYINPDYTFYTAGSGTFINAIIGLAGGVNVFANYSGYPVVTPSNLLLANPQVIFAQEVYNQSYTLYLINNMQGISSVDAYKNHQIYVLSQDLPAYLLNEPGPLSVYAIGMLAAIIGGRAPTYITTTWVVSEFNVTLPVF